MTVKFDRLIEVERRTSGGLGLTWSARVLSEEEIAASSAPVARIAAAAAAVSDARARLAAARAAVQEAGVRRMARRGAMRPDAWRSSDDPLVDATPRPETFHEAQAAAAVALEEAGAVFDAVRLVEMAFLRSLGREVVRSRNPLCAAARKLIAEGADLCEVLAMRHVGSGVVAMTGPMGALAEISIHEGDRGIRRVKFVPFGERAVGASAPITRPASDVAED